MIETIEDIVRDMRDDVRTSRVNNSDPWARIFLSASNRAIGEYADRIEKAYNYQRRDGSLCTMSCRESGELLNQFVAENKRLRALVKELADALNASCDCHCRCDGCKMADESKFDCPDKGWRSLVARAREEVKDGD